MDYKVVDKRRVTAGGANRPTQSSLPAVPYRRFRDAVEGTWRHVKMHMERGLESRSLRPVQLWLHVWGLGLSSRQTLHGVTILVSDRLRPQTLPLQGAILVRAMLEALGNILALTSQPNAIKWFLADGYRRFFEQTKAQRAKFGGTDGGTAG